jgi:predicted GNAT family N-acyltransferase
MNEASDRGQEVELVLGDWASLKAMAAPIRFAVFVDEQRVPAELELDEFDADCLHALARVGQHVVGTARLLPDGHVGRMAVLASHRGRGIGMRLLSALITRAFARGDREVRLNAQVQALGFYARAGFEVDSDEFLEAGIPHRAMRLRRPAG